MAKKMLQFLKKFTSKTTGAAALEFGFVAPVMISAIIGLFEVGLMMVVQNALDAAAREASRYGITGQSETGLSRDEAIRDRIVNVASRYSGGIIDPTKISIAVKSYPDLESIDRPEPFDDANENGEWDVGEFYEDINNDGEFSEDQGVTDSFGAKGEAVHYEITYTYESIMPFFAGNITLRGESPVVNEDFPEEVGEAEEEG